MPQLVYIYNGKPLDHKNIELMRSKEIVSIIRDFYVDNEDWNDEKFPPLNCQFRIVLSHSDIVKYLRMLILCGEAGIYWRHDFKEKLIVVAFPSKKELEISIVLLEEQMRKMNLSFTSK